MSFADSTGRSISASEALLIFDLDETILAVNSFPRWARYMLTGRFPGLSFTERMLLSCHVLLALAKRKLLHERHIVTKRRLQQLWMNALQKDNRQQALAIFLQQLGRTVRPSMQDMLAYVRRNETVAILATAAVAEYAVTFGGMLGFTHIIASPHYSQFSIAENARAQKRDNVLAYIAEHNWQDKKRIFFTDHEEDLPLIQVCSLVGWFGSERDRQMVKDKAPGVEIIPCLGMTAAQVMALILP